MAWAVTGHEAIRTLFGDPRVSKDPQRHWPAYMSGQIPEDWPLHIWVSVDNMLTAYGTEHRRLRSLVSRAFTVRRVAALRPWVREMTEGLVDKLAALPPGQPADLRELLAKPLPTMVICHLFGVPEPIRPRLAAAIDGIFRTTATPADSLANQQELYSIFTALVAQRREQPGDDLTSALIAVREDDGSKLTEKELVDTLILLVGAGHETTMNLIDLAITALLTHPEQLALVKSGEVSWVDVIDETMRWQAPVANLPLRYALEDIDLTDEITIRKGDAILASFAAAGRDKSIYGETADRYDVTRERKTHLSFGHGVHYCLGVSLAKLETEVALSTLFDRFPGAGLAVAESELAQVESFVSNGHQALPVYLHGRP
ncbi:MAG: cytochrome P450 [Kibdelosporangium sp.]